jgi:hypothetical protein
MPFVTAVEPGFLDVVASHDPTEDLMERLSGKQAEDDALDPDDWEGQRAKLAGLIELLPAVEQDLLHLQAQGVRQQDAAALMGWTQANVSYRLLRAHQRLRFLRDFPYVPEAKFRTDLIGWLTSDRSTCCGRCPSRLARRTQRIVSACLRGK